MRERRCFPAREMCWTLSAWLGVGSVEFEQLGEAEDGIERSAQLVAHAGEEFALGPAGHFGLFARLADADFGFFALDGGGEDVTLPTDWRKWTSSGTKLRWGEGEGGEDAEGAFIALDEDAEAALDAGGDDGG